MPSVFEWFATMLAGAANLLERLQLTPVIWRSTMDNVEVELLGIACKLDKPQSHYLVRYKGDDGVEHTLRADHDFDGRPPDVLWLDDALLPHGDMDIMIKVFQGELWLQFEWKDSTKHRLRLATNLQESPLGQVVEDLVMGG